MSITHSTSVAQTNDRVLKASSPRDKQSEFCRQPAFSDNPGSLDYAPLFKHTYEAIEVHEIEDDNMSITRSISIAQTDNMESHGK